MPTQGRRDLCGQQTLWLFNNHADVNDADKVYSSPGGATAQAFVRSAAPLLSDKLFSQIKTRTFSGSPSGAATEGRPPKGLVFVRPADPLQVLVQRLFADRCHMAPVVSGDPLGKL